MSSLVIGHLDLPGTPRYARAYEVAGERAGDVLAGRTVWCATALPRARRAAEQLRDHIEGAAPDGAAETLHIRADEQQLSALLIEAVRERGAHAIWRVRLRDSSSTSGARQAMAFVRRFTPGVDAYVITWQERVPHGEIFAAR